MQAHPAIHETRCSICELRIEPGHTAYQVMPVRVAYDVSVRYAHDRLDHELTLCEFCLSADEIHDFTRAPRVDEVA